MDLDLPQRKKPDVHSMSMSPDTLREWVDRLPLLNTGKTRQLLVDTLDSTNKLDLTPDRRNEMLEILSTSVMCVIDALKKDFIGKPLPLQERYSDKADQALELCRHWAELSLDPANREQWP